METSLSVHYVSVNENPFLQTPAVAPQSTEEASEPAEMPPGFLFKVKQDTEWKNLNSAEHLLNPNISDICGDNWY